MKERHDEYGFGKRFPTSEVLVQTYHVTSVIHLQKGETLCGTRQTRSLPFVFFGRVKVGLSIPFEVKGPGLVSKVVAARVCGAEIIKLRQKFRISPSQRKTQSRTK